MDPVLFLFDEAQAAYKNFLANPTAEVGEQARKALVKLQQEVEARIDLHLRVQEGRR